MMHELEVVLAELVHKVIPNAESIRISKTGADVTSAAIRVARAYTEEKKYCAVVIMVGMIGIFLLRAVIAAYLKKCVN